MYWTAGLRTGCAGQFKFCTHDEADVNWKSTLWKRLPAETTKGNCLVVQKNGFAFVFFQEKIMHYVPDITTCYSENVFFACQKKQPIGELIETIQNSLSVNFGENYIEFLFEFLFETVVES